MENQKGKCAINTTSIIDTRIPHKKSKQRKQTKLKGNEPKADTMALNYVS